MRYQVDFELLMFTNQWKSLMRQQGMPSSAHILNQKPQMIKISYDGTKTINPTHSKEMKLY